MESKCYCKLGQRLIFLFFWPLKLFEMLEGNIRRQRLKRIFIIQQPYCLKAVREPNLQALIFFCDVPHSMLTIWDYPDTCPFLSPSLHVKRELPHRNEPLYEIIKRLLTMYHCTTVSCNKSPPAFLITELQVLNRLAEEEAEGAQKDLHQVESVGIFLNWNQVFFRKLNQAISILCKGEEETQQEKDVIPGQQVLIFF